MRTSAFLTGLAAVACVGTLQAHHSISAVDISQPVWIKGSVLRYEPRDPHVMITLEEKTPDGSTRQWTVDGPNLARLKRIALAPGSLKVGDIIEVCGFPLRSRSTTARIVHGHVLVVQDRQMRHWGPYGKLDNCIRPGDRVQDWVDFLDADPLALESWCKSQTYLNVVSVASPSIVRAISRQVARPCN
jgi:hypothetical protein